MITVAKERIGVAIELLEQTTHTEERVQLVGLIDLARDELSKALKEAKERQGTAKRKELKGQEKLPLDKPAARRTRAPKNAVGVDTTTGLVVTTGDVNDPSNGQDLGRPDSGPVIGAESADGRCDFVLDGERCHLQAGHAEGHSWSIEAPATGVVATGGTNPERCGYIDPTTNNRCIAKAFHPGEHTFLQTFSQRENLPEKAPETEPVL